MTATSISVVVLTYNRLDELQKLLHELSSLRYPRLEIVVVDNCSEVPAATLAASYPQVRFLLSSGNIGTGGRNIGISQARGDIVVCLDDDVGGLTDDALITVSRLFEDPSLAGACFKVIEAGTGLLTNWVHHRAAELFVEETFETYEITEGAVAFRRSVAIEAGLYPESFFISHEGPDLAFRIMDLGYQVIYTPAVEVKHAYSPRSRASWRNYYYDTRNTFWLVARNCPLGFGFVLLLRQVGGMFAYSLRDGFLRWWWRGVRDGLTGLPQALRERKVVSKHTMSRIRCIDQARPGLVYLLRKRLFQRGIKI